VTPLAVVSIPPLLTVMAGPLPAPPMALVLLTRRVPPLLTVKAR
jgi:hypothetical protein